MYLCVACVHIFYISMEMLVCLCTSLSVCIYLCFLFLHLTLKVTERCGSCVCVQLRSPLQDKSQ